MILGGRALAHTVCGLTDNAVREAAPPSPRRPPSASRRSRANHLTGNGEWRPPAALSTDSTAATNTHAGGPNDSAHHPAPTPRGGLLEDASSNPPQHSYHARGTGLPGHPSPGCTTTHQRAPQRTTQPHRGVLTAQIVERPTPRA